MPIDEATLTFSGVIPADLLPFEGNLAIDERSYRAPHCLSLLETVVHGPCAKQGWLTRRSAP